MLARPLLWRKRVYFAGMCSGASNVSADCAFARFLRIAGAVNQIVAVVSTTGISSILSQSQSLLPLNPVQYQSKRLLRHTSKKKPRGRV